LPRRARRADAHPGARPAAHLRREALMTTLTAPAFAFLFTGILLNAGAQLLLKAGTNALGVITLTRDNWFSMLWRMAHTAPFIAGVACYGVSLLVWIMGLSRVPVSIAYPLLSLAYIINAIAAYFLFGEAMTVMRWLGLGLIIAGVFLIARPA